MSKKTDTKKVYVFVLEGWADKNALEQLLKQIYRNTSIYSVVMYGDVTSDKKTSSSKLVNAIATKVREKLQEDKIKKADVYHIFQICDMDGAFSPDSVIKKGIVDSYVYSPTSITVPNIEKAKERNRRKRDSINELLSTKTILGVDFKLFYMSSNLDHALYDIQNLDDDLKIAKADEFYEQFRDCPVKFIDYLIKNSFEVPQKYLESWEYIKEGCHSLERHNNLFICFKDYPPYAV